MSRGFSLALSVGILVLLGVVISCVYTVSQTQQVVLTQFGAPVGLVNEPGLHVKSPLQRAYFFDRRLLNLDAQNEEVITLDKKRIVVDAFARWRITDPLLFQAQPDFNIAVDTLKSMLTSDIRAVLGGRDFSVLLSEKRSTLLRDITKRMNADVKPFGVTVVDVRIKRADLASQSSEGIYQHMTREAEGQATRYRAEGDEAAQRIKADADREAVEIKAAAQSQAAVLRGEGDAAKIRITAAAFGQDPNFYAFWRSLQAYQDALQSSNTTLILSTKSDFLKYLSDGPGGASGGKKK